MLIECVVLVLVILRRLELVMVQMRIFFLFIWIVDSRSLVCLGFWILFLFQLGLFRMFWFRFGVVGVGMWNCSFSLFGRVLGIWRLVQLFCLLVLCVVMLFILSICWLLEVYFKILSFDFSCVYRKFSFDSVFVVFELDLW